MDNNRHLSTTYSQDTHRYKHGKIDIFRRLSTLFTTFIIIVIIIIIIIIMTGLLNCLYLTSRSSMILKKGVTIENKIK